MLLSLTFALPWIITRLPTMALTDTIKLIIADDHIMFRQGITALLNHDPGIRILAEAANGQELLLLLNSAKPDIILLDIQMPVMNGSKALDLIVGRFPDIRIIMLSMEFNSFLLEEYIRRGVHGFIPKGCDIEVLADAIYLVKEQGNCHKLSYSLLNQQQEKSLRVFKNDFALSPREVEVLSHTCRGKTNKEIAMLLNVKERTVEFHKTNIYLKTGLNSSADLISYGIKHGLDA